VVLDHHHHRSTESGGLLPGSGDKKRPQIGGWNHSRLVKIDFGIACSSGLEQLVEVLDVVSRLQLHLGLTVRSKHTLVRLWNLHFTALKKSLFHICHICYDLFTFHFFGRRIQSVESTAVGQSYQSDFWPKSQILKKQ
jgi:hypothetical protein